MSKIKAVYLMPHPPIIIPEVGKGEEIKAYKTIKALSKASKEIAEIKPKTIVFISPHGNLFGDAISILGEERLKGDLGRFNKQEVKAEKNNNIDLVNEIDGSAWEKGIQTIVINKELEKDYQITNELDHGVIVPMYFIDQYYSDYNIVHINYGLLPRDELYKFGMIISEVIEGIEDEVVVVASGDLSHCVTKDAPATYSPEGIIFDEKIIELLENDRILDVYKIDQDLINKAEECGLRSIDILLGVIDGRDRKIHTLSYEHPFGVGYAVVKAALYESNHEKLLYTQIKEEMKNKIDEIRNNESEIVSFARQVVEQYVKTGKRTVEKINEDNQFDKIKAGIFVSIKKDGKLRGCIGTIEPTQNSITEEVINNAISASTKDPRFSPVGSEELNQLVYSVDILKEAELISDVEKLDPQKYGVIVEKDHRRGLLLPMLEGIDTIEEQIEVALKKANIDKSEDYLIYRFEVRRYT